MHKILLVDDDNDLLTAITQLLKKANFQVHSISNAGNINEEIKLFQPQLIILDILLQEEDGRDICLQLKEDDATKHIKIILYSAFRDTESNYEAYGADGFILKPFHSNHLIEVINYHLDTVMVNSL